MVCQSTAKTTKIGPLENFPLYGTLGSKPVGGGGGGGRVWHDKLIVEDKVNQSVSSGSGGVYKYCAVSLSEHSARLAFIGTTNNINLVNSNYH